LSWHILILFLQELSHIVAETAVVQVLAAVLHIKLFAFGSRASHPDADLSGTARGFPSIKLRFGE
jgi:hypothetical protein